MTGSHRLSIHLLIASTLLAIVGAGCGSAGGGTGSPGGGSTAHSASTGPTAGTTDDQPRDDLTDEKAVEWIRYERISPHRLRVFFTTGDPKCYGSRAIVRQSSTQVAVAVIVGVLPGAPKQCTAIGRYASLLVTLDAPLGDRRVIELPNPPMG